MSEKKQPAPEASEHLESKTGSQAATNVSKESDTKSAAQNKPKPTKAVEPISKAEVVKETTADKAKVGTVKVTQVGSSIARKNDQERTLIGLGLGKIGRSRILESTPSVYGMINKVKHLIKVEAA